MTLEARIDYSQYGQPSYFRRFIANDAARWVVDVGAHDGIDGSNSRELILDGWSAILIEPLPEVAEVLQANSASFDRVRVCQAACGEYEGEGKLFVGLDGTDGQSSSLCTEDAWKHNHSGLELQVPVRRLTSILEEYGCPPHFGVLSVDAEGMDLEVLSGLDFSRFRPSVICTEDFLMNPEKDGRKHGLLAAAGYRRCGSLGPDSIWSDAMASITPMQNDVSPLFRGPALPPEIAAAESLGEATAFLDGPRILQDRLIISGWAAAPDRSVPGIVLVGLESNADVAWVQSARHPRSDVAKHFQTQDMLFTGFTSSFAVKGLPPETRCHVVQFADGRRYENAFGVTVPV